MPRNGSGVYSPPAANYPAVAGTTITAADRNAIDADTATALTSSVAVNGESVITNDIPMSNNKVTGLKTGTAATDAANLGQVQSGASTLLNSVTGTDTITATLSPTLTAYAGGQMFKLIPANTNTGAVTININSLGAKAITKNGATALESGDLAAGVLYVLEYDGTQFQALNILEATDISGKADLSGATFNGDVVMSGAMAKWSKGADVASATALPLITDGNYFDVTGTTDITSFDSVGVGAVVKLHFDGILTLTHHATDLVLLGGADIPTAAGDEAEFVEYASGDYRMTNYSRAAVSPTATVSEVRLHTANGNGSTNNRIRRFLTEITNTGSDITYADSATLGATFTIETDGIYAITFFDTYTSAGTAGISLNSTQLTTAIESITAADRLTVTSSTTAGFPCACSWTGSLSDGDVVRAHTQGDAASGANQGFSIVRLS